MCGYVSGTSDLRGGTGKGPGNIDLKKVPQTLQKWYGISAYVGYPSRSGILNATRRGGVISSFLFLFFARYSTYAL